jgi:hypothetical protein
MSTTSRPEDRARSTWCPSCASPTTSTPAREGRERGQALQAGQILVGERRGGSTGAAHGEDQTPVSAPNNPLVESTRRRKNRAESSSARSARSPSASAALRYPKTSTARAQRAAASAAKGAVQPTSAPWARTISSVARLNSGK